MHKMNKLIFEFLISLKLTFLFSYLYSGITTMDFWNSNCKNCLLHKMCSRKNKSSKCNFIRVLQPG